MQGRSRRKRFGSCQARQVVVAIPVSSFIGIGRTIYFFVLPLPGGNISSIGWRNIIYVSPLINNSPKTYRTVRCSLRSTSPEYCIPSSREWRAFPYHRSFQRADRQHRSCKPPRPIRHRSPELFRATSGCDRRR